MTQTDCITSDTTAWVSGEYRELLGQLRSFLTRKFTSLREAASYLGRSHNFLNSVLSGRTQLKLPALLRILHVGGSSLPVLHSEAQYYSTDPLKILRHVSSGSPESPAWLDSFLDLLLSDRTSGPDIGRFFEHADLEVALYVRPWQLQAELEEALSELTGSNDDSLTSSSSLLRLSLLWARAASRGTPGHSGVLAVFEAIDSCLAQVRSFAWMRPEVFLALADCVAQVDLAATRAITREVVHSAIVQDHFLPLAGALLLDAEVALLRDDGELADRILRSLARNISSTGLSDTPRDLGSISSIRVPEMLEQSHSFYSRLLIASSWRHWMIRDFSRARSDLAELRRSTAAGLICPSVFEALAAWLDAAIARAIGQFPDMERYLSQAAALDLGDRPARAALAHVRRLSYFWTSGQQSRFQATIHQNLGSLAVRLPPSIADDVLQCRARYSRGSFDLADLRSIEHQLERVVLEPAPWNLPEP